MVTGEVTVEPLPKDEPDSVHVILFPAPPVTVALKETLPPAHTGLAGPVTVPHTGAAATVTSVCCDTVVLNTHPVTPEV